MMNILLSNDDGYQAPGLICLARAMETLGDISIVAPQRNRSGASSSLTLERPLRAVSIDPYTTYVDGTPSDCVHLAITGLLKQEPDIVVSGINNGANLGDDVIYSGTVAAAIEGRFLGFPAIAVSLVGHAEKHYNSAAAYVVQIMQRLKNHPLPSNCILNINVPDLPLAEIKGIQTTRLGNRHKAEPVIKSSDPRGHPIYWVGPPGAEQDAGPGTDFYAVNNGYVSVSPIKVDLTHHGLIKDLDSWLQECESP